MKGDNGWIAGGRFGEEKELASVIEDCRWTGRGFGRQKRDGGWLDVAGDEK